MARVRLGKVVRALGLKGLLGVAGTEGALGALERVWLERPGQAPVQVRIAMARPQGRLWALQVDGIDDRTGAEAWIGAEVAAERDELGEAGEGQHYWADLEGMPVVTVDGAPLGRITGLYETGGVDVLVVTGEGRERLIPLAPYVEVDRKAGRVVVDPPDGLLET
ncbi:MAG: ribosome maturation factor RimM [Anaeromyxobacteraceae bacterium]